MKKKLLSLIFVSLAVGALSGCGKPEPKAECGDGKLSPEELCDTGIKSGNGVCPTQETCEDDDKVLEGTQCQAHCVVPLCGNGKVDEDAGETCDINAKGDKKCLTKSACEAKNDEGDGNSTWAYSGNKSDCTATCKETKYECKPQKDDFCPQKCSTDSNNANYDADCKVFGEVCDTNSQCLGTKLTVGADEVQVKGICYHPQSLQGVESPKGYCNYLIDDSKRTASVCLRVPDGAGGFLPLTPILIPEFGERKGICDWTCTNGSSDCSLLKKALGEVSCLEVLLSNPSSGAQSKEKLCKYSPVVEGVSLGRLCQSENDCGADPQASCLVRKGTDKGFCTVVACLMAGLKGCPANSQCTVNAEASAEEILRNPKESWCRVECDSDAECNGGASSPAEYVAFCEKNSNSGKMGFCDLLRPTCENTSSCNTKAKEVCEAGFYSGDLSTRKVCAVKGNGTVALGGVCKDDSVCPGGFKSRCAKKSEPENSERFCTADCTDDSTLCSSSSGFVCSALVSTGKGTKMCLPECTEGGNECDAYPLYSCQDVPGMSGKKACLLKKKN